MFGDNYIEKVCTNHWPLLEVADLKTSSQLDNIFNIIFKKKKENMLENEEEKNEYSTIPRLKARVFRPDKG